MKKRIFLTALTALILALAWAGPAHADGIIIIDPPPDTHEPINLVIKYHKVTVTIEGQVATTHVDQVFVNESQWALEGTYIFPMPEEAAISEFGMWVDGQKWEGKILERNEARRIYEDIVRRQRDPALLEYVGRNTFQASIFPIEPGGERRVEIEYSEVLPLENGLVRYVYPLDTERFSSKPIEEVSIHVDIHSEQAIKAIYSPSHKVAIDRQSDYRASVGYEEYDVLPDVDFQLYYTVSEEDIGLNLLSYKGDEGEDGFFLLLVAPKVEVDEQEVVSKDVIFVLDTSGSMSGEKIEQAKDALRFVLDNLNPEDRFNIVAFSTGVRQYAESLRPASERDQAEHFVWELEAAGGTDINRALLEALGTADAERPTIVIFLTDGLATEGVTETERILENVADAAQSNVRIFPFGVGDDVNTILLDTIAENHRGASAYVRPGQNIEEEVSTFYAKVSTPLLADVEIDFGDVWVRDTYPYPLPDLFAGSQLVLAGRYSHGGPTTITLSGVVNGRRQTFTYEDVTFRETGGPDFIPRLWATRKVGYLLKQIRLHGESRELVDEIVDLAVRYGIMTPYTSFLVNEDVDILSEEGREETARREYQALATPAPASGAPAVEKAQEDSGLAGTERAGGGTVHEQVKQVGDKAFVYREGVWTDTTFDPTKMTPVKIGFGSDAYFELLAVRPEWGKYFAVGQYVIVVLDGTAYQVVPESEGQDSVTIPPTATPTSTPVAEQRTTTIPASSSSSQSPSGGLCSGAGLAILLPLVGLIPALKR
ncbi:MAG: VIT domain-containing protein [Anaerolineae bacterium]|jgi:Ca-activated chloride channel family protein|nr:VIT domain-containing protein [Anaerolineae bacterium]MDH7475496.1 VIT domain-containing protein [Anaerolineae bacterium]